MSGTGRGWGTSWWLDLFLYLDLQKPYYSINPFSFHTETFRYIPGLNYGELTRRLYL